MSKLTHYQSSDGSYIIEAQSEFGDNEASELIGLLAEISYTTDTMPTYAVINMTGHYVLPLREFSGQLKRLFREMPDTQTLYLALVVDEAVVSVLTTIVKTLVRRESIQYFTNVDKAHLWLNIERKKQGNRQQQ